MHELEVPLAHARLQVNGHQRFGKQVVAGAVATVLVNRGRLDRQVDDAGFGVRGDLRPHAVVTGVAGRLVLPRVEAELAAAGDALERPQQLAGADVKRAGLALHVGGVFVAEALEHRRAHQHHVVDDGGGGVQTDFRLLEVRLLAVDHDADLEVDNAGLTEARDGLAGLGVQRHELVTGGHVDDTVVALAVGPVGEAAA